MPIHRSPFRRFARSGLALLGFAACAPEDPELRPYELVTELQGRYDEASGEFQVTPSSQGLFGISELGLGWSTPKTQVKSGPLMTVGTQLSFRLSVRVKEGPSCNVTVANVQNITKPSVSFVSADSETKAAPYQSPYDALPGNQAFGAQILSGGTPPFDIEPETLIFDNPARGNFGFSLRIYCMTGAVSPPAPPAPPPSSTGPQNPILFVTQVPVGGFGTSTSVFGNHLPGISSVPRGGDLMIRYPDGSLRNLTLEAGLGSAGMQGANGIAVREPSVHFSGTKALFSMIVGAATQRYQVRNYYWQVYEVTGLGAGQTASIRKVQGQPANYNNVSPIYGSDGKIIFVSDRPATGQAHHYPQRDEYESAPIVAGIYSLDEDLGTFGLLEHSPSGVSSLSLDSFGRVIFTKWDHLQRDQQGDAPSTAAAYQAFTFANESAGASTTTSLVGAEVFPEARTAADPSYDPTLALHSFNHFFPWEMNEDGSAEETLNHVGRHELGGTYSDGSFVGDPNLSYYTPESLHKNRHYLFGSGGMFHLRENPGKAGEFFATVAQEFGTASGGTIVKISGAPSVNPEDMEIIPVTPPSTIAQVPTQTGYFRNPLPTENGVLVAVHTAATGQVTNTGSSAAPAWNYDFRLKVLSASGAYFSAGSALTSGIVKNLSWWTPDELATYNGPLWELDPVEVVARPVPAKRVTPLPAIEVGVFAAKGVDVEAMRTYLRQNQLALIVGRNITQRDRSDRHQPFNLRVPGGVQSIGASGPVYDTAFLQIFQGDALRGYGNPASPQAGRRILPRPMHGPLVSQAAGGPLGAVRIAPDGSFAAIVPAQRALTWQLTNEAGGGVVRERNWVSFQAGEIRVCTACHGINKQSQTGSAGPTNEPQALHELLASWNP